MKFRKACCELRAWRRLITRLARKYFRVSKISWFNLAQLIKYGKTLFIFQSLVLLILLISEVSFWTSTLSVIVLTLQIIAGSSLLLTFANKSEFAWQEIVGLGIVLGSILTFGFDQIFRNTPIAIFAWSIPVILCPLVFWRYLNKSEEKLHISVSTRAELTVLFAAAFLILATEWFWPLPLAIMLLAKRVNQKESQQN